jgi:AraC-like DNA-binding protein
MSDTSARLLVIGSLLLTVKLSFMTIYIKNMVCIRCKMAVEAELIHLGLHFSRVELGLADITEDISPSQHDQIRTDLLLAGLELIDDIKGILIEKIKKVIIDLVHYSEEPLSINLSVHLSQLLHHNYTYMANIFSEAQGHSIERFVIEHKIERVKELLIYNELNLTEIAYKMHYSSVAHLSSQFKKVTGQTASHYKRLQYRNRVLLETI